MTPRVTEWAWEVDRAGAENRARRAARMVGRARYREMTVANGAGRWHRARADALRRGWTRDVDTCGTHVVAGCGCGHVTIHGRCGVGWACDACARRRWGRMYRRARVAVRAIARAADVAWRATWRGRGRPRPGTRPVVRMVTLTLRHSGDVHADVMRGTRAWDRWRAWLRATIGSSPHYVRVREVTPGQDRAGHVHWHVVMAMPYVSWSRARAAWSRAVNQTDAQVDFGRASSVESAARYVAKYVAKGSVDGTWDPWLAARVIDATYMRRAWTTSRAIGRVVAAACNRPADPCRACGADVAYVRGSPTDAEYRAMLARLTAASAAVVEHVARETSPRAHENVCDIADLRDVARDIASVT
jgi:hypothetical protein